MSASVTNCDYCGKEYTAKRSTSRYCSPKCRVRYNRDKEKSSSVNVEIEVSRIADALARLKTVDSSVLWYHGIKLEQLLIELGDIVGHVDSQQEYKDAVKKLIG